MTNGGAARHLSTTSPSSSLRVHRGGETGQGHINELSYISGARRYHERLAICTAYPNDTTQSIAFRLNELIELHNGDRSAQARTLKRGKRNAGISALSELNTLLFSPWEEQTLGEAEMGKDTVQRVPRRSASLAYQVEGPCSSSIRGGTVGELSEYLYALSSQRARQDRGRSGAARGGVGI